MLSIPLVYLEMKLLTLARACAAKGYCSRSVGRSVGLSVGVSARFLSNRGCCRYQTWICGYMGMCNGHSAQHVYGGGLKLYTAIILGVH